VQLEKPQLFNSQKSFFYFITLLTVLFLIRLTFLYQNYQTFVSKPFYFTSVKVLYEIPKSKNGRKYKALKVHSDEGLVFFTTAYQKVSYLGKRLRLQIFPNAEISFWDYLGTFYVKSRIKEIETLPRGIKEELLVKITSQHSDKNIASFYNAIFFATPLDKGLREEVSKLGVSHLVALSGFHLTILWGMIYSILLVVYRPLQQRLFPYRFTLVDLGSVAIVLLALYLWFVDFPPSLVRAYAMVLVGWLMLVMGIELISFSFLAVVVGMLLVLFPALIVSLGFWLSVAGVFAIFLLLQYTKTLDARVVKLMMIPFGIFILMQPVVHGYFGVTTVYQLLSPFLSLAFIPFYPIAILLHLIGYGGILDSALLWLFTLPQESVEHFLPTWTVGIYIVLAMMSIFSKRVFGVLLLSAISYTGYLFIV
jgi:competence protein ComEC